MLWGWIRFLDKGQVDPDRTAWQRVAHRLDVGIDEALMAVKIRVVRHLVAGRRRDGQGEPSLRTVLHGRKFPCLIDHCLFPQCLADERGGG